MGTRVNNSMNNNGQVVRQMNVPSDDPYGRKVITRSSARDGFFPSKFGPSHLIQIGLDDLITEPYSNPFKGHKRVIFVIPGNPGVIEMYRFFMQNLYNETKIPVFGVSHVGHIKTQVHKVRGPMTLHKQIEHKVDFIERFIPRDVEIILVGHSIGAFMANQIMRLASDKSQFYHNFQLFPTIERMAETKGARVMSPLFFFKYLVMPIIFILSLLKDEILIQMIIMFIDDARRCPRCIIAGFLQVVNVRCLKNIVDMAQDEFRQVQERNDRFISQELSKLTFVYCPEDRWAPLSYYRDLKRSYPRGDIILMNTAIHAFVTDMHVTKSIIDLITNRIEVKIREEEDGVNGFSGSNHCVSQQILVE